MLVTYIAAKKKNRVKDEDLSEATMSEFFGERKKTKLDNSQELNLRGMIKGSCRLLLPASRRGILLGEGQKGDGAFQPISTGLECNIRILGGSLRWPALQGLIRLDRIHFENSGTFGSCVVGLACEKASFFSGNQGVTRQFCRHRPVMANSYRLQNS